MEKPVTIDPIAAPIWRKRLALRVLALSAVSLYLAFWLVGLIDEIKPDLPRWLVAALILPAVVAFFAFIINLASSITDLVVHFVPPGRLRQLLLRGDRSPEEIAKEFGQSGYLFALSPFFIVLVLFVVTLIGLLLLGGLSALGRVWAAVADWPSWAIVITVLLVLLLLKK